MSNAPAPQASLSSQAPASQAPASQAPASQAPASQAPASQAPFSSPLSERRALERHAVTWSVDCEADDTFLYAAIANISELGIFVRTESPLKVGTAVTLRFLVGRRRSSFGIDAASPAFGAVFADDVFVLRGTVQWVNIPEVPGSSPNPGMGVRFVDLTPDDRERLVELIHTIAYLREPLREPAD